MLDTIAQLFWDTRLQYAEQFLVALLPMAATVLIHGQGMGLAGRYFRHHEHRSGARARGGPHVIVLIAIVAIMLAAHSFEATIWAIFYLMTGMLSDFKTAMFYSVESYTTLGASNIELPGRWRGLGGLEAMTAMLMFGWSTAVLAVIVLKSHEIDA